MLIYQQNPGAMFCNSYKAYQDMGYSVKRGEHGMKILVPTIKTYLNIDGSPVPLSKATKNRKRLTSNIELRQSNEYILKSVLF